jgi:hypothetical protein
MKLSHYGGIYAGISRGIGALSPLNTHSYLHRSSISLDEFGFLAKKIVTKVWTQRLSADPKYGFFDGLFVLEIRAAKELKQQRSI